MIYTVTFNPALDYIVEVGNFRTGLTNRTKSERMLAGGKGLNVSQVLKNLGILSTALGFTAGFTGKEIIRKVEEAGYEADFIELEEGMSRINVKLITIDGTEINGQGPDIPGNKLAMLLERLDRLASGDMLVLAGSIPDSVPDRIYEQIMERLAERDIRIIVDATGELLVNALKHRPFLVKPNNHELGDIFGVSLPDRQAVIPYALKLQEQGARNVLVSMAGEGAVLVDENGGIHETAAPKGRLVNGVGAGDSMVAGFLAGYLEEKDYGHAFKMGVAAGSASAFSEGLAVRQDVEAVYRQLIEN